MAQLNFTVGGIQGNLNKILKAYETVAHENSILVCSELALTGYYPQDLLVKSSFIESQNRALQTLIQATENKSCSIVLGVVCRNYSENGKPLHNALVILSRGQKIFEYHKRLLPTYNIFDEARHFEAGTNKAVFEHQNMKLGFLICEDAWSRTNNFKYVSDPVEELKQEPLDLIISINASPSNLGKMRQRFSVIKKISKKCNAPVVYVNQVGGNDELIFDGASFVTNQKGLLVKQMQSFVEQVSYIDLTKINEDEREFSEINHRELILQQTVLGIRDYVNKCGFQKVVVGSSGGIDSAVTLAICCEALGADNVTAITMPSYFSSKGSVDDSVKLCDNLGIKLLKASIAEEFDIAIKRFETMSGEHPSRLTQENIQARIRGRILMEFSNHFGALVISTGNKSEMSVGYATLYGDMNGGINPLGDLYKMEVYELAKHFNQKAEKEIIPLSIIEKEPSAELSEDQKDSDALPEYPLLDAILKLYIEGDLLNKTEIDGCKKLIEHYDISDKEISIIHNMVNKAEFKRRQAPPIIRVQQRSFGMGRRLPVAAVYSD